MRKARLDRCHRTKRPKRGRIIACAIATSAIPPTMDHTIGNGCPPMVTTRNIGRRSWRAGQVPTYAPKKPTTSEMTNMPRVSPAKAQWLRRRQRLRDTRGAPRESGPGLLHERLQGQGRGPQNARRVFGQERAAIPRDMQRHTPLGAQAASSTDKNRDDASDYSQYAKRRQRAHHGCHVETVPIRRSAGGTSAWRTSCVAHAATHIRAPPTKEYRPWPRTISIRR